MRATGAMVLKQKGISKAEDASFLVNANAALEKELFILLDESNNIISSNVLLGLVKDLTTKKKRFKAILGEKVEVAGFECISSTKNPVHYQEVEVV